MTAHLLLLLSQIDSSKLSSEASLNEPASSMWAWLLTGLLTVGILLVTFKTSKRNATDRD